MKISYIFINFSPLGLNNSVFRRLVHWTKGFSCKNWRKYMWFVTWDIPSVLMSLYTQKYCLKPLKFWRKFKSFYNLQKISNISKEYCKIEKHPGNSIKFGKVWKTIRGLIFYINFRDVVKKSGILGCPLPEIHLFHLT